jgi:putative Ca2+/H+ antiporter (TMEM165/GDT1 family)
MRVLDRLYAFIGWAIVALGGLHMLVTLRLSASTPAFRVWFFGSGMAMALVGALNLLHRVYGHSAIGLRIVCRTANILLTLFALVAGALTGASIAEYILIMSLVGGALILSYLRSAHSAMPEVR